MGTYAEDDISTTALHGDEASLVDKFKNVGLKSDDHQVDDSVSHPLRPYADDCSHYLRTGACKFGLTCRYNHPVKRTNTVGRDRDKQGNSQKSDPQIECKYYLTPGGCKYGEFCRYSHSRDQSEISVPELNFVGLPIRLGERDCPFYMRHGSCRYGARCVFHHPDPTSFGLSNLPVSAFNQKTLGEPGYANTIPNGESGPLQMLGSSESDHRFWSSQMPSGWEGYQVQDDLHGRSQNRSTTPAPSGFVKMGAASPQVDDYPERPGQLDCGHFLKTGDCKFKSACRYHHPKDRIPRPEMCMLSDKGLPLRPGKSICRHYERYGICKFGRACLFDHPDPVNNDLSRHSEWSSSEPVQSHDTGYWED